MLSNRRSWVVIPILIMLLLGACNFPGAQPTENPFPTFAAQTVEARLTLSAEENPPPVLPEATDTPQPVEPTEPEPTASPTNTAIPTQTEVPCDRAAFVSDVTIPDGTLIEAGDDFTKTWRLRNTGSCSWNASYQLTFKEGDAMSGPASKQLTSGTVSPGQTVDISVDLTAPNSEGEYRGDWLIRSDAGIVFGVGTAGNVAFYVEIEVGEPPPSVLSSGKFDVPQTYGIDLDTGTTVPIGAERDFKFTAVNSTTKYIEPWNSALFRYMGGSLPSLSDCMDASLNSNDVDFFTLSAYDYFCYKTTKGNYGRMEIEGITDNAGVHTIHFDYTTWDT
jgi:hypothetical protein